MVNAREFVVNWGYYGLFGASLIESEPVLICMSFLSRSLSFNIILIFLLSVLGTFLGTTISFFLGRYFRSYFKSFELIKRNLERVDGLLAEYRSCFVVGFRFIYGIKLVSPIIIGFSNMSVKEFLVNNIIGSILWAFFMILFGYCTSFFVKVFSVKLVVFVYILTIIVPFFIAFFYKFIKSFVRK